MNVNHERYIERYILRISLKLVFIQVTISTDEFSRKITDLDDAHISRINCVYIFSLFSYFVVGPASSRTRDKSRVGDLSVTRTGPLERSGSHRR